MEGYREANPKMANGRTEPVDFDRVRLDIKWHLNPFDRLPQIGDQKMFGGIEILAKQTCTINLKGNIRHMPI